LLTAGKRKGSGRKVSAVIRNTAKDQKESFCRHPEPSEGSGRKVSAVIRNTAKDQKESFCRHPERSEGSRRTQLTTTARAFHPIGSTRPNPATSTPTKEVSAVILSAAKDPEELNSPQPPEPFIRFGSTRPILHPHPKQRSFCRHPERSEGSRRAQLTTTAKTFHPIWLYSPDPATPP
jgi:hypothetical protein